MGLIARWEAADVVETDDEDAAIVAVQSWVNRQGESLTQAVPGDRPVLGTDDRGQRFVEFNGTTQLVGTLGNRISDAAATQLSIAIVGAFELPQQPRTILRLDNDVDADPFFEMSTLGSNQGRVETQDVGAANSDLLTAIASAGLVGRTWTAELNPTTLTVSMDAAEDTATPTALFSAGDLNRITLGGSGRFRIYGIYIYDEPLAESGGANQVLGHSRVVLGFSSLDERNPPGAIGLTETIRYDASVGVQSDPVARWQQHTAGISQVQPTPANQPTTAAWASKPAETAIVFDGINDFMTTDPDGIKQEGFDGLPLNVAFAFVLRATGSGDRQVFDSPATGPTGLSARVTAGGDFEFVATGDMGTVTLSAPVPNDVDIFVTGRVGGANSVLRLNGLEVDSVVTPAMGDFGSFTPGDATIGAAFGGGDAYDGQIADIAISNGDALDDGELLLLDVFIAALYGVPIGVVAAVNLDGTAGVSGDPVDSWTSEGLIAGSVTAAGADRPVLTTMNGRVALDFSGAEHMADTSALNAAVDGAAGITVFMVVDLDSPSNMETLLHLVDGSAEVELFLRTGSALLRAVIDPGTGTTTTLDGPAPPSVPAIIDFRAGAGVAASLRVDGVEVDSDVATAISLGPHTSLTIMADSGGTNETAGDVGQVLILDHAVSDTYRDSIYNLLLAKWI